MQHLEDGYLHEIADGEVPSEELVAVREHLDACESCRARLDQARMEAETARELVELIDVPELVEVGAVSEDSMAAMYAAPMRAEFSQVSSVRTTGSHSAAEPPKRTSMRWVRPLAWAASLVLAAGIGYASRSQSEAALASRLEPTSLGRIDTVFLDIPAQSPQPDAAAVDGVARDALQRTKNRASAPPAESPRSEPPAPARQNAAGARAEEEQSLKRAGLDTTARVDEVVVTKAAEKKEAPKDADAKLQESFRERAANDLRDQPKQLRSSRPQPAAPSVAGATAEGRLMAKTSADESPTIISFPRAVELLGGRIKLIEGMVPHRLEAVGRTVRVIYLVSDGDLVLAQVSAPDSLNWSLSGPVGADSLLKLRMRVK